MQRLSTILLAVLGVIVFAAAVYVIADNGSRAGPGVGTTPSSGPSVAASGDLSSAGPNGVGKSGVGPSRIGPSSSGSSTPSLAGSSGSTAPAKQVVVFLGDEWTAGKGASTTSRRFTTLVSARLGLRERNLGRSGSGYATGTDYGNRVADVVAARPDVVVVAGGRDDVVAADLDSTGLGTAEQHARALFATLHAELPDATIVAVAPMWGDSPPPQALIDLRTAVRKGVTAVGGTYLDLADPITGHPDFMADDSDPDDAGYTAIAAVLAPALAPLVTH